MSDYLYVKNSSKRRKVIPDFFASQQTAVDGSVLPFGTPDECYNCDCSDGALKQGIGISADPLFSDLPAAAFLFDYRRFSGAEEKTVPMCILKTGEIYYYDGGIGRLPVIVPGNIKAVNYRLYGKDVVLLCSDESGMTIWDGEGEPFSVEAAPKISSLCMHYERMFATCADDIDTVRFSDDFDPTNWNEDLSEGGFIRFADELGKSNRVLGFLNYVYVFRDYGITRITAYADQSEFSAVNLFVSSGKIFPGSVTQCGDTVIFLASDGLYMFNGISAEKTASGLDGILKEAEDCCAAYCNGKYYLSLKLKTGNADEERGGMLIVYDIKTGIASVARGLNIESFFPSERGLCAVENGRAGIIDDSCGVFGVPLVSEWKTPLCDLGSPDKIKTVREMYIDSDGLIKAKVYTDIGGTREFILDGGGIKRLKVSLRGRRVGIKFSASGKFRIARPALIISD